MYISTYTRLRVIEAFTIISFRFTMSINETCPSVSTTPIPSVSNPDLWEYNPEELVRFTPLRRFSSSTNTSTVWYTLNVWSSSKAVHMKDHITDATCNWDRFRGRPKRMFFQDFNFFDILEAGLKYSLHIISYAMTIVISVMELYGTEFVISHTFERNRYISLARTGIL